MSTWADYGVLGWLIVYSAGSVGIVAMLERLRKTHAVVRYKQPFHLYGMALFGVVGSWAAFIANDHLIEFTKVTNTLGDCSLWSYWMQHVLGITMWMAFVIERVLNRIFVFHPRWSVLHEERKIVARISVFFLVVSGPVIISSLVSYGGLSAFSSAYNSCQSPIEARLALMVWYIVWLIVFRASFLAIQEQMLALQYSEYMSLTDIWAMSVYVFSCNVCINLFGVDHLVYGRVWYTTNISVLFCFTLLRICGSSLWDVAFKRSSNQTSLARELALDHQHLSMADFSFQMMTFYFNYAEVYMKQHVRYDLLQERLTKLGHLMDCYSQINLMRTGLAKDIKKKSESIVAQFFADSPVYYLDLPDAHRAVILKTFAENGGRLDINVTLGYLYQKLCTPEFYGQRFLNLINRHTDNYHTLLMALLSTQSTTRKYKINARPLPLGTVSASATGSSEIQRKMQKAEELSVNTSVDTNTGVGVNDDCTVEIDLENTQTMELMMAKFDEELDADDGDNSDVDTDDFLTGALGSVQNAISPSHSPPRSWRPRAERHTFKSSLRLIKNGVLKMLGRTPHENL